MALEAGAPVFIQLPVRYPAVRAYSDVHLFPEPPGRPAIAGIVNDKTLIAMRGNAGLISHLFNGSNAVQQSLTGGPEFDFIDQTKEIDPFAIDVFDCCRS